MKKILLVGALALLSLFSNAQDGLKGTWFAGGQVAFGSNKSYWGNDEVKYDNYTFQPLVGIFISSDVAVGAALGYSYSKSPSGTINSEVYYAKNSTFIVQPFVRKYWNITGGLYFFGQGSLPASFGTQRIDYPDGSYYASDRFKTKTKSLSIVVSPGFDYIITDWMSIEASFTLLSAGYTSSKPDGEKSSNSFSFNGDTHSNKIGNIAIGFKFLF